MISTFFHHLKSVVEVTVHKQRNNNSSLLQHPFKKKPFLFSFLLLLPFFILAKSRKTSSLLTLTTWSSCDSCLPCPLSLLKCNDHSLVPHLTTLCFYFYIYQTSFYIKFYLLCSTYNLSSITLHT